MCIGTKMMFKKDWIYNYLDQKHLCLILSTKQVFYSSSTPNQLVAAAVRNA